MVSWLRILSIKIPFYNCHQTKKKHNKLKVQLNDIAIHNTKIIKIKEATKIRNNIIKSFPHKSWGTNATSLKQINKSIVFSKLEHDSFIYINVKEETTFKIIETIRNTGLRLIIRAFRLSLISRTHNTA